MTDTLNLDDLVLAEGGHDDREQGVCLLEAVAKCSRDYPEIFFEAHAPPYHPERLRDGSRDTGGYSGSQPR